MIPKYACSGNRADISDLVKPEKVGVEDYRRICERQRNIRVFPVIWLCVHYLYSMRGFYFAFYESYISVYAKMTSNSREPLFYMKENKRKSLRKRSCPDTLKSKIECVFCKREQIPHFAVIKVTQFT